VIIEERLAGMSICGVSQRVMSVYFINQLIHVRLSAGFDAQNLRGRP
jgi:hypothetical protein